MHKPCAAGSYHQAWFVRYYLFSPPTEDGKPVYYRRIYGMQVPLGMAYDLNAALQNLVFSHLAGDFANKGPLPVDQVLKVTQGNTRDSPHHGAFLGSPFTFLIP